MVCYNQLEVLVDKNHTIAIPCEEKMRQSEGLLRGEGTLYKKRSRPT